MFPTYVALDLETTGTDPARDTVIEIGAVKFRGDEVLDEFHALVHPGRPIPHEVTVLTGIRDEDVADAPRLTSVLPRLASFVGDRVLVGHSVDQDLAFLRRFGILQQNRYLDTFKLASVLAPDARRYSLEALASMLGFPPPLSHRALDDARTVHRLFMALLDRATALSPALLEELIRLGERAGWPLTEFFRLALRRVAQRSPTRLSAPAWPRSGDSRREALSSPFRPTRGPSSRPASAGR